MEPKTLTINNRHNQTVWLKIFPETAEPKNLWELDELEAQRNGEAPIQLMEGFSYEYELTPGFSFVEDQTVIYPSKREKSGGRIVPGIFVGTLKLYIRDEAGVECGFFELEVRSSKASYRKEYRFMLESIAEHSTDLILRSTSPVFQRLTYDYSSDPDTDYQRFSFIQSMLDSDGFDQALHRILSYPVSEWSEVEREQDIRRLKGLSGSELKRIASDQNRFPVPENHSLYQTLPSLPTRITTTSKVRTVDTPENRFVKHALSEFRDLCSSIRVSLESAGSHFSRACIEAKSLEEKLSRILNQDFFRELSPPDSLPLNSPVLQRKEGYREVLRIWLLFDLAARLIWRGGEDVYRAGKRDVALLYEYWLFFVLTDLIEEVFYIQPDLRNLFEETPNGLGIKLKSGRQTVLSGVYSNPIRDLHVEFSYNKTFSEESSYPNAGSWTKSMRPDYSISFWPVDVDKDTAEKQELIIHIHFDAKYRVKNLQEILGGEEFDLDSEKDEQRRGTYKRADLLKMHAYKDAIRRTAGAYVLYPGNSNKKFKGFHEIIPGLGAFTIRPSQIDNGSSELQDFLEQIRNHLLNRASQRHHLTYRIFDIFEGRDDRDLREAIPEVINNRRVKPPEDMHVLVGYCKSDAHREWVLENRLYNFRLAGRGAISEYVDPEMLLADYLLLHWQGYLETKDIYRITHEPGQGPRVMTASMLEIIGYPDPRHEEYLVYQIAPNIERGFDSAKWDLTQLAGYRVGRGSGFPFAVSLLELMEAKVPD